MWLVNGAGMERGLGVEEKDLSMAVKITEKTKPGDLYLNNSGELCRIQSYFTMPSVTMESVVSGSVTGGGVGCLNLEPFKPLEECSREELLEVIKSLAEKSSAALEERIELKNQVADLKMKLEDMREKIFNIQYVEITGEGDRIVKNFQELANKT